MTVQRSNFENLIPSQFISFTFPNPLPHPHPPNPYSDAIRIAVLDSPHQTPTPPQLAAMLVPKHRHNDWIFSTETGHHELLSSSPSLSRLILVGDLPNTSQATYTRPPPQDSALLNIFITSLTPLLLALSPDSAFVDNAVPDIPFLSYEDGVIRSVTVEKCDGSCVGEMLVENVEIEGGEFRRRLRFKRMPNLIQTEIKIITEIVRGGIEEMEFRIDGSCLVHAYLPPMVAGLSLISKYIEESSDDCGRRRRRRVLCIGVGGGALLSFLKTHFGFEVYGVESDEMVVKVAKKYFGLEESESLRVYVGDGIDLLTRFARKVVNVCSIGSGDGENNPNVSVFEGLELNSSFDVIMVDLDARDAVNGNSSPPSEFIQNEVLLATKLALQKHGILVINFIPVTKVCYEYLINELQKVFEEVYEINVGNDENYVLIASVLPLDYDCNDKENSVLEKLKPLIPKQYIHSIRKL